MILKPIGIGSSLMATPSHADQHTGPYCAVRLIDMGLVVSQCDLLSNIRIGLDLFEMDNIPNK